MNLSEMKAVTHRAFKEKRPLRLVFRQHEDVLFEINVLHQMITTKKVDVGTAFLGRITKIQKEKRIPSEPSDREVIIGSFSKNLNLAHFTSRMWSGLESAEVQE